MVHQLRPELGPSDLGSSQAKMTDGQRLRNQMLSTCARKLKLLRTGPLPRASAPGGVQLTADWQAAATGWFARNLPTPAANAPRRASP